MTISEYAQANGLDPDTALTHLLLFSMVEASRCDEQWQRRTFETLVGKIDAGKLAASVREVAKEIATPAAARPPELGPSADSIDDALRDLQAAYGTVYETYRFGRELGRADWQALHERLQSALESLDDEPAEIREAVDRGALGTVVWNTLQMPNSAHEQKKGASGQGDIERGHHEDFQAKDEQ